MEICDSILLYLDGMTKDEQVADATHTNALPTFKVVTWNVLRDPVHWPFDERKFEIFRRLQKEKADIICVQEVWGPDFKQDWKEFLVQGWSHVVQTPTGSGQRNYSGILFRKERFRLQNQIHRSAGVLIELEDLLWPSLPSFYICTLHLNGGETGLEFGVKCAMTRYNQLRGFLVKTLKQSLKIENIPELIIAGDFNCFCEENAAPHIMLREGKLLNGFCENGLPFKLKKKSEYDTGWIFTDVYDDLPQRPSTFAGFFDFDGGEKLKAHNRAIKQRMRYWTSFGNFSKDDFIPFPAYEKFMKSKGSWCFTQDWNPDQDNRNWFCERDIVDIVLIFAYGNLGTRLEEMSLDYIYYPQKHFTKIGYSLPATPELQKYSFDSNVQMPNDRNPSDHFPITITLQRSVKY